MRRRGNGDPATLRSEAEFSNYAARHAPPTPAADAEAIAQMIARKHCAGRRGSIDGAGVLAALAAPPGATGDASRAVSWMLSTIRAHECALLVTRCGVGPANLARHVRARPVHRTAIVRFLNQFAIRQSTEVQGG